MLYSARWLALSYFTYFFSFGIFLPLWSVWLNGEGVSSESIGMLLGGGLIARFLGNLFITSAVKNPVHLITSLRILAMLTLICGVGFAFGNDWLWLMLVIAAFNLFFGPISPLSDALAGIWQHQIAMDYGKVRLWGSLAFIVGTSITGEMVDAFGHQAILVILISGISVMLLGMLLRPSVMPEGELNHLQTPVIPWLDLLKESNVWRFLLCVTLIQGAHAAYYAFSTLYWQEAGFSTAAVGYLWSLGVLAEIVVFAFSDHLFRRWSVRGLLILSILVSLIRWGILASTTALPWLIAAQLMHSGTFTVCHLAAIRFISARQGGDVIRLQAVYSALATGGGIALMTMVSGILFEHVQSDVFWVMAMVVIPGLLLLPSVAAQKSQDGS